MKIRHMVALALMVLPGWLAPDAGRAGAAGSADAAATAPPAEPARSVALPPGEAARSVVLERVELEGNTRTQPGTVLRRLNLRPGEMLDPARLHELADVLRGARLFSEVQVHTRPGSEPGRVVVVFRVRENQPRLRLGAGYEDLSGWYLIPLQLDLANLTGHGETLDLNTRLGYRVAGLVFHLRSSPESLPRPYWDVRLRAEGQDRVCFLDETELNQRLERSGVDVGFGAPLGSGISAAVSLSYETAEPDSEAVVYRDSEIPGRERGDRIPATALPPGIQDGLGRRRQGRLAVSLDADERRGQGLLIRGVRGRLRGEAVTSAADRFFGLTADARGYAPLKAGILLAGRLRAQLVTAQAPFYERLYLGGLYTVRGYPGQSLSPPEGNLRLCTASIEIRSSIVGPPADPRVAGILFADVGWAGNQGGPRLAGGSAGIGYGLRVRVPWVRQVGLDVGVPLSPSPFEESFRVDLSLGWTY